MTGSTYHRIILDSVIKRHGLPNPRLTMSEPHPHHPFIATVEVKIETRDGPSYFPFASEPRNVRAKAEDQACQKAIAGLGEMGYSRHRSSYLVLPFVDRSDHVRTDYKNELNNKIVNGSRNQRTLDFHRTQSGPNDQRKHTSTVMIDGETLPDYTATSTREIYADELACKMYLEANYPEYRY